MGSRPWEVGGPDSVDPPLLSKVVRDIRSCINHDQGVILMLLDISAAFETVDYDMLVGRLFTSRLGFK